MASGWIVKRNNKELGPFSAAQLKKLVEMGTLRPTDLIRKEESGKFVKAEKVKGLFDAAPPNGSAKKQSGSKPQEILVAEVVEVIDEEPIVLAAEPEPIEAYDPGDYETDFEDDYEDYAGGGFDDYEDYDDYEARAPRRSRAPNRRPAARRRSAPKKSSVRKVKKKANDEEDGPWQLLFGGVLLIGVGIFLFFLLRDYKIVGVGLIPWTLMLLDYIGGRWAVLIFFVLGGIAMIVDAIRKFAR